MRSSRVASAAFVAAALLACACGPKSGATPPGPPAWHVVLQDLEPTLLSAWGTSATDVFVVGGPLGNGGATAAMHYDGSAWTDLQPGGTETFWWVNGTSDSDVWLVGTSGRIAHWDGAAFTPFASGTTATLYGVWAAAPNDVWAVGGTPDEGAAAPNDVLLHFDGTSWSPSALPQTLGRAFFKVWGTASSNLYVVGEYGTIWHRTGTTWTLEASTPPLATGNLTTVAGCSATQVYAVGGQDVLVSDGATWSRADVSLENGVNGVSCGAGGDVALVGFAGLKQRLVGGDAGAAWVSDFADDPHSDLHGVWADPSGGFWAVGGDFVSDPRPGAPRAGLVAYYGSESVGGTRVP